MRSFWYELRKRPETLYERNRRNVVIDGMGVAIVNAVATFLSVFLVRLGASNVQVGLLTSMPAIMGAIFALPAGQLLQRQTNLIRWYASSRLWVLSSYALTGLVPFISQRNSPAAIVLIWALATIPQVILNVTFTMVMSAIAGPSQRISLMSTRWTTMGVITAASVAVIGWVLDHMRFPLNYQVVFMASFVGGLIAYFFSLNIQLPSSETTQTTLAVEPWYRSWQQMGQTLRTNRRFTQFIFSQFVFRAGMGLAIPLLPLYWVKEVQANDAQIGLINTTSSFVLVFAYALWATLSRRRGERLVLLACCLGLATYPVLVALTHSMLLLPLYAGLSGFFAAGIDLVLFDLLIAVAPPDQRGPSIGLFHTTTYAALFVAPLLGTALIGSLSIPFLLIVAGLLRFLGFGLFAWLGVGQHAEAALDAQQTTVPQR